jgi:Putative Actinobacterial Holin-X, holin superfamily III
MQQDAERPSLGAAFGNLLGAVARLVDLETDYAKTEMTQKASTVGKDVAIVVVGGALAYGGFLLLLVAVVNMLAALLPRWLAALLVGLLVAGAGGLLAQQGLEALEQEDLIPKRTLATVKAGMTAGIDRVKDQLG